MPVMYCTSSKHCEHLGMHRNVRALAGAAHRLRRSEGALAIILSGASTYSGIGGVDSHRGRLHRALAACRNVVSAARGLQSAPLVRCVKRPSRAPAPDM